MDNLYIEIIQLSGAKYFWMLKDGKKIIACSHKIGMKRTIENEVNELSIRFGFEIIVNERQLQKPSRDI